MYTDLGTNGRERAEANPAVVLTMCIHTVYCGVIDIRPSNQQELIMATATARTRVINLRTDDARRTLIDRAAEAMGKDRTEFMLDAATREAQSVLLDRRLFHLDEAAFRRFAKALDAPPADNPRLRKLLAKRAPWER